MNTHPIPALSLAVAAERLRAVATKATMTIVSLDNRKVPPQLGTYQVAAALGVLEALAEALEAATDTGRSPEELWTTCVRSLLSYALSEWADGAEDGGLPAVAADVRAAMANLIGAFE